MTPFQKLLGDGTAWLIVAAFVLLLMGQAVAGAAFLTLGAIKWFLEHCD